MTWVTTPDLIIWCLTIALEVALMGSVLRFVRRWPVFASYCGFCLVRSLALLTCYLYKSDVAYFITYWVGIACGIVWMLLCAREVLTRTVKPQIPKDVWDTSVGLVMLVGAFGGAVAGASGLATMPQGLMTILTGVQRVLVFVLTGVFAYVVMFPRSIYLPRQPVGDGLALGFLVSQATHVAAMLVGVTLVGTAGFVVAQLQWLWTLRATDDDIQLDMPDAQG